VGDEVSFRAPGVVEVELLQALAAWEPRGPDPALPAVGLPGGDLPLQAGDEELLVRPGIGASPLREPGYRLPQRRRLQRPGQERDLGCQVADTPERRRARGGGRSPKLPPCDCLP
jgi:hypothetical protein